MEIDLSSEEILCLLDSVHGHYLSSKSYYAVKTEEEDRDGIIKPESLKKLYNNILCQAQNEGEYKFLDVIK